MTIPIFHFLSTLLTRKPELLIIVVKCSVHIIKQDTQDILNDNVYGIGYCIYIMVHHEEDEITTNINT